MCIESYVEECIELLKDFKIKVTPEIVAKLRALYPNEIAIDNYVHTLIFNYLDNV